MRLRWPKEDPTYGRVRLRAFLDADVAMVRELASDPYVPLIGTLPAHASVEQALAWIQRQRGRLTEGAGFSFCVADLETGRALGTVGLWTHDLREGIATLGYSVAPQARGRGVGTHAAIAATTFAWTMPAITHVDAFVEAWNLASIRTLERAGYARVGTSIAHQVIDGCPRDMLRYRRARPGR